jgi:hypothetical protein
MSSRHTPRVNIGRDDVRPPKKANRIFLARMRRKQVLGALCAQRNNARKKKFERLRHFTAQPLVSSFEPGDAVENKQSRRVDMSRRRALYAK